MLTQYRLLDPWQTIHLPPQSGQTASRHARSPALQVSVRAGPVFFVATINGLSGPPPNRSP